MIGTGTRGISQHTSSEKYSTVLRQILSLQFDTADRMISEFAGDPGTGPEMIYLRNYLEFLTVLMAGQGAVYEKYLYGARERLDAIQSGYGQFPERLALISAIHLQSSFLNALHGENIKAARSFYVARRYLRQAESVRPGQAFHMKLDGLINVMAGSAPPEYHWLMRIFGIWGDIQLGLDQLLEYHGGTSGPDRLESCLFLLYASQITGQGKGEQDGVCGSELTLHRYFHAYQALTSGKSLEVIELLDAWRQAEGEMILVNFDLLLGEALLNSNDPGAGDQLIRFLENTRGEHFVKTAWHKLSWHHFLAGDSVAYQKARDNVLTKGNLILDADKQAYREAAEDLPPNAPLLRSRLYFDGGFYQKSMEALQQMKQGELASEKDSLEFTYRMARIADRLGERDGAISGYHKVLRAGTKASWYFPSNAALHLGLLYEEAGDTVRALESYQACLKMNRSGYRNSIGNKARLGIKRLK